MRATHDERLQLHHAARPLASAAHALLPRADDDSHTSRRVERTGQAFGTQDLDHDGLRLRLVRDGLRLERWAIRRRKRRAPRGAWAPMRAGARADGATRPKGTLDIRQRIGLGLSLGDDI